MISRKMGIQLVCFFQIIISYYIFLNTKMFKNKANKHRGLILDKNCNSTNQHWVILYVLWESELTIHCSQ